MIHQQPFDGALWVQEEGSGLLVTRHHRQDGRLEFQQSKAIFMNLPTPPSPPVLMQPHAEASERAARGTETSCCLRPNWSASARTMIEGDCGDVPLRCLGAAEVLRPSVQRDCAHNCRTKTRGCGVSWTMTPQGFKVNTVREPSPKTRLPSSLESIQHPLLRSRRGSRRRAG